MVTAKEISLNAAIAAVSSELVGIFKLKEQKNDNRLFSLDNIFTDFGIIRRSAPWLAKAANHGVVTPC